MVEPFLRPATAAKIDQLALRGAKTTQLLRNPANVTIRRRDPVTGWGDVAIFQPIRVDVTPGFVPGSGLNEGASEIANGGTMRVFTPTNVQRGDRFRINDQVCVVGLVQLERHGTKIVTFTFLEGE